MYTMSIGVTSIETGPVNYTCDDGAGNVFETIPVVIETRGQRATVSCTFEAQTGQTAVRLVPDDVDVSSVFTRAYASAAVQDDSSRTSSARSAAFSVGQAFSCSSSLACSCSG